MHIASPPKQPTAEQPTVVLHPAALKEWLAMTEWTQARLARELAISKGRLSQLLNTPAEPSARLIAKLLLVTRLPFHRLFRIIGVAAVGERN